MAPVQQQQQQQQYVYLNATLKSLNFARKYWTACLTKLQKVIFIGCNVNQVPQIFVVVVLALP